MAKYPIEKYNIVVHQNRRYGGVEVIAWSTYAGKPVYGKAICRVEDEYNSEVGIRLAVARCAAKIAKKRKARAEKLYLEAINQVDKARSNLADMKAYHSAACDEYIDATMDVENILKELA